MSGLNERRQILKESFNKSFVDDYEVYKSIIQSINDEFKELGIEYEFTYDEFCVSFLKETMENLKKIDILNYKNFQDFYFNFWDFNLYVIREVLKKKIESLGYDFEEIHQKMLTKNYFQENFSGN